MTQSFLTVNNIKEQTLIESLADFVNDYADRKFAESISIYREKGGTGFLVTFQNAPGF
jgi:hypothetical protein